MKKHKKALILSLCALLWVGFILFRSMKNAEQSTQESNTILELVRLIIPNMSDNLLRKLAHFTEFAILGTLLTAACRSWGRREPVLPGFLGLVTALTDETVQLFVEGRAGMVQDVWIDFGGVTLGVLLVTLTAFALRKRRKS